MKKILVFYTKIWKKKTGKKRINDEKEQSLKNNKYT